VTILLTDVVSKWSHLRRIMCVVSDDRSCEGQDREALAMRLYAQEEWNG